MISIETAKKQAETLAEYLRTVGKKLKHTHALEAVARMNGHKSWNIFQSSAVAAGDTGSTAVKTAADLVELFASDSVAYVTLDGVRYEVEYYDSQVLGCYREIIFGSSDEHNMASVGVVLKRDEDGLIWEEELTIERISNTLHQPDGTWIFGDGTRMELFATVALKPA